MRAKQQLTSPDQQRIVFEERVAIDAPSSARLVERDDLHAIAIVIPRGKRVTLRQRELREHDAPWPGLGAVVTAEPTDQLVVIEFGEASDVVEVTR